ncbi:MAG: stage III sporulation protein AB [Oscillospiraceae bacterium]|nr:stage III sporulation protein AB [Oscillospiraceae bacterium]
MLKGIGLLLLVFCGGLCGFYAAATVRRKQQQLLTLSALLHELEISMWCHGGTLQELLELLKERETYRCFSFLRDTIAAMQEQAVFSAAWREAVQADSSLSEDSKQLLYALGEELGISDLYSQREILERYRSRLQQQEAAQRENSQKKIKLYQSMGLLAGMAVAILLC